MKIGEGLARFLALTDQVNAAEDAVKDLKAERGLIEEQLREAFAEAGLQNVKATDGRIVYLSRTLWASARDGDRLAVTKALTRIGASDLVTQTYNANTLSAFVREHDANGQALPPELAEVIEVYEKFQLNVRAS